MNSLRKGAATRPVGVVGQVFPVFHGGDRKRMVPLASCTYRQLRVLPKMSTWTRKIATAFSEGERMLKALQ